jgi:hypothetical protein
VTGLVGDAATSSVATRSADEAATDEVAAVVATTAVATAEAVSKNIGAVAPILFGDEKCYLQEEATTRSFEPSDESSDGKFLYFFINLLFYICLSFNIFLYINFPMERSIFVIWNVHQNTLYGTIDLLYIYMERFTKY